MADLKYPGLTQTSASVVTAIVALALINGCAHLPRPGSGNSQTAATQPVESQEPADGDNEALASLGQAALRDQADTSLQIRYATALATASRDQEALKVAQKVYNRDKREISSGLLVARLYIRLGDGAAAQAVYKDILSNAPDNPRSLNGLGITYVMERMLPTAEATFRRAVAASPTDSASRSNLALALALEGKTDEAIPMLEAQLRQDPVSDRDRTNLALAYAVAGNRDKAVQLLRPRMTAAGANAFVDAYAPHGAPDIGRIVSRTVPRVGTAP